MEIIFSLCENERNIRKINAMSWKVSNKKEWSGYKIKSSKNSSKVNIYFWNSYRCTGIIRFQKNALKNYKWFVCHFLLVNFKRMFRFAHCTDEDEKLEAIVCSLNNGKYKINWLETLYRYMYIVIYKKVSSIQVISLCIHGKYNRFIHTLS